MKKAFIYTLIFIGIQFVAGGLVSLNMHSDYQVAMVQELRL